MNHLNKFSKVITQDSTQPAAQAMLHAIGLTKEDFKKPLVGIASTGYEGNPCNMHLNDLAKKVKTGTQNKDIIGLIFNTIGVSDGISMGTPKLFINRIKAFFRLNFIIIKIITCVTKCQFYIWYIY